MDELSGVTAGAVRHVANRQLRKTQKWKINIFVLGANFGPIKEESAAAHTLDVQGPYISSILVECDICPPYTGIDQGLFANF